MKRQNPDTPQQGQPQGLPLPIPLILLIGIIGVQTFTACGKGGGGGPGVYVAGYDGQTAVLWKDGVAQKLTDGSGNAKAKSVYVSGNDVYVAGYKFSKKYNTMIATLWKNGAEQKLTNFVGKKLTEDSDANSVYVSGKDVYVAGKHKGEPCLWKNGEAISMLLADYEIDTRVNSVYASGNDVYVAGRIRNTAVLWKYNGEPGPTEGKRLAGGNRDMEAKSVYVFDDDVYVAGVVGEEGKHIAVLWKNSTPYKLSDVGKDASSVYVSGNDVYVAGYEEEYIPVGQNDEGEDMGGDSWRRAVLWKNGVPQRLEGDAVERGYSAKAGFVYASGDDAYVAGMIQSGLGDALVSTAVLWKNGVLQKLSEGSKNARANSVFVVEQEGTPAKAEKPTDKVTSEEAASAYLWADIEASLIAEYVRAEAEGATKEETSCGDVGGGAKLLECITDNKGVLIKKFEYDRQNRIVKVYERDQEKIFNTITITYNTDSSITVKRRSGDTENIVYPDKDGNEVDNNDCEYSYDNKKSPLFNTNTPKWLLQKYGLFSAGKNNILREYCSGGEISFSNDYKYEYDSDGFPTKETKKSYVEGEEGTEIIRYAYLGDGTEAQVACEVQDSLDLESLLDLRDCKTYRTVNIDKQIWMAENLNYKTKKGSWCYNGKEDNCAKYGRLYNWKTANRACPAGWRLPDAADWNQLAEASGGWEVAGKKLKSKSGWKSSGNGTDDFGFSALPGGNRDSIGIFSRDGQLGYWWSATEYLIEPIAGMRKSTGAAGSRIMYSYNDNLGGLDLDMRSGYSVRCLQDKEKQQ